MCLYVDFISSHFYVINISLTCILQTSCLKSSCFYRNYPLFYLGVHYFHRLTSLLVSWNLLSKTLCGLQFTSWMWKVSYSFWNNNSGNTANVFVNVSPDSFRSVFGLVFIYLFFVRKGFWKSDYKKRNSANCHTLKVHLQASLFNSVLTHRAHDLSILARPAAYDDHVSFEP